MAIYPLLKRPCTICSWYRALGQQLFHIIFRKSNKMVLPAGFANWMVLFQIKKQKQKAKRERRPNYPLVERKAHKSFPGSLPGCSQPTPSPPTPNRGQALDSLVLLATSQSFRGVRCEARLPLPSGSGRSTELPNMLVRPGLTLSRSVTG